MRQGADKGAGVVRLEFRRLPFAVIHPPQSNRAANESRVVSYPLMRRKLFTLAAAVSAVLCAAACVLWVRSYLAYDLWGSALSHHGVVAGSYRGHLLLGGLSNGQLPGAERFMHDQGDLPSSIADHSWASIRAGSSWYVLGFGYSPMPDPNATWGVLILPTWFLAAGCAALPTLAVLRARARRRRGRAGHCRACGYDLRATPECCPECGTAVAAKGATA